MNSPAPTRFFICEKPSQARVLAKALDANAHEDGVFRGDGVTVAYCYGHLQNLATPDEYIGSAEWRIDELPLLPGEWKWKVSPAHQDQFNKIGRLLSEASSVVIATDPDEEGEVIGRQILRAHGYSGEVRRLWMSALDPDSLTAALRNLLPLSATEAVYRAGMMRRLLDWLLGMNLSRAYTIRLGRAAHIGRVKTKLLTELVRREDEIIGYSPTFLDSAVVDIGGYSFDWLPTAAFAPNFVGAGICVSCSEEVVDVHPPLPFNLSSLLIHANETAGIGLAEGYEAAQTLYEAGAISYPRTSSRAMPSAGASGFAVHHAITATRNECPNWAGADAQAIYEMVRFNGVLQQLGAAKVSRLTTVFDFGGERFSNITEWTTEENAGWLLCMPADLDRYVAGKKGKFWVGQRVQAIPKVVTRQVPAPNRYTEATLLRMMVANNIGTEATRVEAIASLSRDRVSVLDEGEFLPTIEGKAIAESLPVGLSDELARIVRNSIDQVKRQGGNGSVQLLQATKWLTKLIRGEPTETEA